MDECELRARGPGGRTGIRRGVGENSQQPAVSDSNQCHLRAEPARDCPPVRGPGRLLSEVTINSASGRVRWRCFSDAGLSLFRRDNVEGNRASVGREDRMAVMEHRATRNATRRPRSANDTKNRQKAEQQPHFMSVPSGWIPGHSRASPPSRQGQHGDNEGPPIGGPSGNSTARLSLRQIVALGVCSATLVQKTAPPPDGVRVIQTERMKEQGDPSRAQTRLGNEHRRLDH
jgi:hypothetical protein